MAKTETKVLTAHIPLPLADVDAGRIIDHQAVQAWADSLDTDTPLPLPRFLSSAKTQPSIIW